MISLDDMLKYISRKLPSPKTDYAFHEFFFVYFVLYFLFF